MVIDASAMVNWVLGRTPEVGLAMRAPGATVHVPSHWHLEIQHALRNLTLRGSLSNEGADRARATVRDLPAQRHDSRAFLGRAWALRANVTTYDAIYVALAEALGCPLLTADARLAATPGHLADVHVIGAS